jgi:hypothetical protein
MGKDFTLTKINNSFKLTSDYYGDISSQSNKKLPPVELGFIRRVKNYVVSNMIYENFIDNFYYPQDIDYVSVLKRSPDTEFEVVEIDIDEAYWKTAHQLGVISDDLYQEGSKENGKISKLGRLISLGALAKKEIVYEFKGSRLYHKEIKRSKLTENVWYSICKRLADVMNEAKEIAGSDFVMYWVDGIYVKKNRAVIDSITKAFKKYGYDVKFKENLTVKYTDERVFITDLETNQQRPFFIPKKDYRRSYFTDNELKEVALKYSKYVPFTDLNDEEE